jgi:RNA recognition motif-containing protein
VQFETQQAFENCTSDREPLMLDGRVVRVAQAQTRLEPDTAYVKGIPEGTTREDLLDVFPDAVDARIVREDTDEADGFAFVKFATGVDLREALAQHSVTIQGRQSTVKKSTTPFDSRNRTRRRACRRW